MIFGRHRVGFLFESAQNEAEEKFGRGWRGSEWPLLAVKQPVIANNLVSPYIHITLPSKFFTGHVHTDWGSKPVAPLGADFWGLWLVYGMIHSTAWRKGIGVRSLWPHIYHSRSRPATALSSASKEVQLCWKGRLVSSAKGVCKVKHRS